MARGAVSVAVATPQRAHLTDRPSRWAALLWRDAGACHTGASRDDRVQSVGVAVVGVGVVRVTVDERGVGVLVGVDLTR